MDLTSLIGHWDIAGLALSVVARDGDFLALQPGCPVGFEPRLVATSGDVVEFCGGPFAGGQIEFEVGPGGVVSRGLVGGVIPVHRLDSAPSIEPGSGLVLPPSALDPTRDAEFAEFLSEIMSGSHAGTIDYRLAAPKHEFIRFVMAQDTVIFHGSNRGDIDEFRPIRTSVELSDHGGRGNVGGIYGTHDGVWSMFFAVVDRSQLEGSIRNGVMRFTKPSGEAIDVYNFSIHHEMLPLRPYTAGMLYLLPRDRFEQMPFYPGGPASSEWVCREPVRSLAKLPLDPEDFPFLNDIGGHDDGELIEFQRLNDEVLTRASSARRIDGGYRLVSTTSPDTIDGFVEAGRRWLPDVEFTVRESKGGQALEIRGPDAYLQMLGSRLAHLLG